jgi:hypothetical protein
MQFLYMALKLLNETDEARSSLQEINIDNPDGPMLGSRQIFSSRSFWKQNIR